MEFYLILAILDELFSSFDKFFISDENSHEIIDAINTLIDISSVDEDDIEINANLTSYKITFDPNGGSGTMIEQTGYHGKNKKLLRNKYKKTGYDFVGWTTIKESTEPQYLNTANIKITDEKIQYVTLYAIWKVQTYTITFNANGGTGTMTSVKRDYNAKLALPANRFSKTNYDFIGWNTTPSATTAKYKAGDEIAVKSNLDFYAIWKTKIVTIKYAANGGAGTMANQTGTIGDKLTLRKNAFTRTNYIFKNWQTTISGQTKTFTDGQTITLTSDMQLSAVWEKSTIVTPLSSAKAWNACTKASCWYGDNASCRVMNILSPRMDSSTFNSRYKWSKDRGVNCFHLFISNNDDGEYAGYTIYGNKASGSINTSYTNTMGNRIKKIFNDGYGVILWLMADDDKKDGEKVGWNTTHYDHYEKYIKDIKSLDWFKYCSTVCLGLEINETVGSTSKIKNMTKILKKYYGGKIGVHFGSEDQYSRANGTGVDIIFGQISPNEVSESRIRSDIAKGKKYASAFNMFEISRHDSRTMAKYALNHGAYGVGNW